MKLNLRTTIWTLLLAGATSALQAQCLPIAYRQLESPGVKALHSNSSDRYWNSTTQHSMLVPKTTGRGTSFTDAFWIGGIDNGQNIRVAAATYRQMGTDFYTGPISNNTTSSECGVGFEGPATNQTAQMLAHSSGKVIALRVDQMNIYDPITQTTTPVALPITPLTSQAIELSDGRVFVLGQRDPMNNQDSYVFDINAPASGQIVASLGRYQNAALCNLNDGRLFIQGGFFAEIFNPTTNTFLPITADPSQRCQRSAIPLANDSVFVVGGSSNCATSTTGFIGTSFYDLGTNTWITGPNLNIARYRPLLLKSLAGDIYIFGGSTLGGMVEQFSPTTNTLTTVSTAVNEPYKRVDGFRRADGKFVLTGLDVGYGGDFFRMLTYDPATNTPSDYGIYPGGLEIELQPNGEGMYEWMPGQFREFEPQTLRPVGQRYQHVWSVSKAQIVQFQQDFANSQVNFANYPDIQTWPGNGLVSVGESHHLAPFIDVNMDGWYRPAIDGDYPCIAGDQALWWVYNDLGPHAETGSEPLGVQVETMAYTLDCQTSACPDTNFKYAVFYHTEVTNLSASTYTGTTLALWADTDLGNAFDDYVGTDSALNLGITYNGDANDETANGFGLHPPAAGIMVLPNSDFNRMAHAQYYENDFTVRGNPQTLDDYYDYTRSRWTDGQHVVNNGTTGYPGDGAGPQTNYMFSGDAGFCGGMSSGWTELSAGNMPYDRRLIVSVETPTFAPHQTLKFDYAKLYARSYDLNNLSSVCALKTHGQNVQNWWTSFDRGCMELVTGQTHPTLPLAWDLYPNPAQNQARITWSGPTATTTQVSLLDLTGRQIATWTLPAGETTFDIPLQDAAAGIYLVSVRNTTHTQSRKLVVNH